jgi:L,D-transpeptidase YbiS
MEQLLVDIFSQKLFHFKNGECCSIYPISTALKGVGEAEGSGQTPRGWHIIRAKIGEDAPINTVFVSRRPTGEIYMPENDLLSPERDWILTRILWLSGLEPGKNRLGLCDTMRRYIYIHGSPDHRVGSTPGSKGCIRMRSTDIITLFHDVPVGTKVFIRG